MRLFLLRREQPVSFWGLLAEALVRASSEAEARDLVQARVASKVERCDWRDPAQVRCTEVTGEGGASILLERRTD